MKKNRMMRLASILLVCVLLTTSVISGTFAKYVTKVSDDDSARVAKWGFTQTSIVLDDLFKNAYTMDVSSKSSDANSVVSSDSTDVIAPGTTGSAKFGFAFGGEGNAKPEVDYTFVVDATTGSVCDAKIKANTNIKWKLDEGKWGTWDELITAIEALDGDEFFDAGELPSGFNAVGNNEHTVSWKWAFDATDNTAFDVTDLDSTDTDMGNMPELDDVTLKITITATQVN